METFGKNIAVLILSMVVVVGVSVLLAYPTAVAFNHLFTSQILMLLFGVDEMTLWKSFWFNVLVGVVFNMASSPYSQKDVE